MEKSININDQIAEQISQNQIEQPPANPVPKQQKINYWMISTIVLLVVFILTSVLFFIRSSEQTEPIQVTNIEPTLTPTIANEIPTLPTSHQLIGKLAFIRGDNLWINDNGVEKHLTTDAIPTEIPYWTGLPKLSYSNPQISSDGKKVAYLMNTNTDSRTLIVSDIDGSNMKQLVDDVEWTMPILRWSNDNQKVFYPSSGGMESIIVRSVNVITGAKEEFGEFAVSSGCGGGSSDVADHVSSNEGIISVGGGVDIFDLSPQNNFFVHTISCTGRGLGILDLSTKQDRIIDDKAMRAVISPDEKSIAAISDNSVVVFDNSGNALNTYQTSETPQILLWSADGNTIFYSSSKFVKELTFDDILSLDILGSSPSSYRLNSSALWKLPLESGKSEKIIDLDAHNMKPVFVANQRILTVVVENASALFEYINEFKTRENMVEYYPKVSLVETDLVNMNSATVAEKVQQSSFVPQ